MGKSRIKALLGIAVATGLPILAGSLASGFFPDFPPNWMIVGIAAGLWGGALLYLIQRRAAAAVGSGRANPIMPILDMIGRGDLAGPEAMIRDSLDEGTLSNQMTRMVKSIQKVVNQVKSVAEDVSDVSVRIQEKARSLAADSNDQASSASQTFDSLQELDANLERVVKGIDILSSATETTTSAILEMLANIEEVVGSMHRLSGFVEETAEAMQGTAGFTRQIAENAESLSAFAIENASSMLEMDATIQQVGENAQAALALQRQAQRSASTGHGSVKNTLEGLMRIKDHSSHATDVVNLLGRRSKEIGSILKVIKDITDQTSLLALNASIIAAQAGDHGRGFAVVAEEIKDLSERTAASTEEIHRLIATVQKEVREAGDLMEVESKEVETGVNLGRASLSSLEEIIQQMEQGTASMMSIAAATAEQSKSSRQITESIEEMAKKVESISAVTRDNASTAQTFSGKTQTMRDLTSSVDRSLGEQADSSRTIGRAMEEVQRSVQEIKAAILEMSRSSTRILQAMDVVKGAAAQTQGNARDLAATVGALRQESSVLTDQVSQFKVPTPTEGGVLRTAWTKFPLSMDPATGATIRDADVLQPLHEGLTVFGRGTKVEPGIAENWATSPDGRRYTFRLRRNALFHHGRNITAEDVVYSFKRILDPQLQTTQTWVLEPIQGAREFNEGRASEISGLRVLDPHTLEIELNEPIAFFPSLMALDAAAIVPREFADSPDEYAKGAVGCGAYQFHSWEGNRLVYKRFPGYHSPPGGYPDTLEYILNVEKSAEIVKMLREGVIDYSSTLTGEEIDTILKDPDFPAQVDSAIMLNTSFIGMRCDIEPFNNRLLRQAFCYAVDRERLVNDTQKGQATPARGFLPPGIMGYNPELPGYTFNPERARRLMAEAGYPGGVDIHVKRVKSQTRNTVMDHVFTMAREVGFRITSEELDRDALRETEKKDGKSPLFYGGWIADYPDTDVFFYAVFHSDNQHVMGFNYTDEKLDKLIEEARRITDPEDRIRIYQEAEKKLIEDAPGAFLYHQRAFAVYRGNVGGMALFISPPAVRAGTLWLTNS